MDKLLWGAGSWRKPLNDNLLQPSIINLQSFPADTQILRSPLVLPSPQPSNMSLSQDEARLCTFNTVWSPDALALAYLSRTVLFYCLPHKARPGHALQTLVRGKSSMPTAIWWLPNRHEWLIKESWSRGGLFGLWPNMSPASTYAKSFIKLPLDEADAGGLKLTN